MSNANAFGCDARGYVKDSHVPIFLEATAKFHAYILVRNTGRHSLWWAGKENYTAKRADMKAKTARHNVSSYQLQGLVCSPKIHPRAFDTNPMDEWHASQHLITPCSGFTSKEWPKLCRTPYLMQTDPKHKHYGVVAWVENGLVSPRYVHGDYDLFAVVPESPVAKRDVLSIDHNQGKVVSSSLPLRDQLKLCAPLMMETGPLLFKVMNYLDRAFGYPMVMHAEEENHAPNSEKKANKEKNEEVIVFLPPVSRRAGHGSVMFLANNAEIKNFYATEFQGRGTAWQPS